MRSKKTDLVAALGSQVGSTVTLAFAAMSIAEEVLAEFQPEPRDAFAVLWPTPVLLGRPPLYRAHARELVRRCRDGEDTRPGTAAEVLGALVETSLRAPLQGWAVGFYEWLWRLAEIPDPPCGLELRPPQWPKQYEEELAAARRRLAVETRVVPDA